MSEYVWYASYGSNINEERFLSYITGGVPNGSMVKERGCRDKSLPKDSKKIFLPYPMFFAMSSARWEQKGVCFIEAFTQENQQTLGKMYQITKEQFCDVVSQENNMDKLEINFNELDRVGSVIISKKKFYGKIIRVGFDKGKPIYTFTSPNPISEYRAPALSYLKVIAHGIKETYGLEEQEIIRYLLQRAEVRNEYTTEILQGLFC